LCAGSSNNVGVQYDHTLRFRTRSSAGDRVDARREGAPRKSVDPSAWLETVLHLYGNRVLAFDMATARIAGAISDPARGLGQTPGLAHIIIAATAQHHGLTILSRNLRHFEPPGVAFIDLFTTLPDA
jgi:toxin FitB